MSVVIHEREQDDEDIERYSKRQKIDSKDPDSVLPPSHRLLGTTAPIEQDGRVQFLEQHVGISEYVGQDLPQIQGIIKQRFTDFLVFEVDQEGRVLHLKNLGPPDVPKEVQVVEPQSVETADGDTAVRTEVQVAVEEETVTQEESLANGVGMAGIEASDEPWPELFSSRLAPFFTEDGVQDLRTMFLQGPEPPRVSDSGWGQPVSENTTQNDTSVDTGRDSKHSKRGRGGKRGGTGRGSRQDTRKVLSKPIASKNDRTSLHKLIRELFKGKLDSETDATSGEEGSRIVIRWAHGKPRRHAGTVSNRPSRGNYPPYIHFTMQKTNRDTHDALNHLSRIFHVNVKDLSVAGTKDKRGVTVQRVSLRRHDKKVEQIWKLACGGRSAEDHLKLRGEHGIRICDLNYRKASLELGMLKGNAFVITLRNVKISSEEMLDKTLRSMQERGFINYYGMQRFGTASVPTHAIGLALLQSNWQLAISLIMQTRFGEHPMVEEARKAWLEEGDIDKALALMPKRVVAERCILESYKKQKGDTRNAMGALSTIPRTLRLMYLHAYQSYVWNAIVSERIRTFGVEKPVVGDLVLLGKARSEDVSGDPREGDGLEDLEDASDIVDPIKTEKSRRPWQPPVVKVLTEEDLENYSIFDVAMPLPGTDVSYPGGRLGALYRQYLELDGLDPDNFHRKQRDYTLAGSYRKILHRPTDMSWSILRYTDPDIPLAQSDEDALLGLDPPATVEDGKFTAVQIRLTLGTAAYATMALREITKTDTSTHIQSQLTSTAEDQKYRDNGTGLLTCI